jgi:hypothetical protein
MANAPRAGRDGRGYRFDLGSEKAEIFLRAGLDIEKHETLLICPSGKSIWSAPFVMSAFAGDDSMCRVNISADCAKLTGELYLRRSK